MAHLRNRLSLVPFCDLTDCPAVVHHAIGSPHFDAVGRPLYVNPVVIAVRADIVDTALPRCSLLAVSCNTRPYHSYGPVIRRVFEVSQPHNYPEVRHGIEGVMELGEVRSISPGGLSEQTDAILLGCVTTMTGGTNREILRLVLDNFAKAFSHSRTGSTLRMPLIGTGKAHKGEATEQVFREVVDLTLAHFYSTLLNKDKRISPRRLLLLHPLEYESQLIASMLAEKAVFLTVLDKLGISSVDETLSYGLAHGDRPEHQFVDSENFAEALDYFDVALDHLLADKRREALQEAAKGVQLEPSLDGIYSYISTLSSRKRGLIDAITREALSLAARGRIRDAFCVGHPLQNLGGGRKEQRFIDSLRECYMDYCVAALEARLLYENYMETEQALQAIINGANITDDDLSEREQSENLVINKDLLQDVAPLEDIRQKIPQRLIENTFHIAIRKFMADDSETLGARRAVDNLLELQGLKKISLSEQQQKICQTLLETAEFIENNRESMAETQLRQEILQRLLQILPNHGTLRLEAARYHLRGSQAKRKDRATSLTRADIIAAWEHLDTGYRENPRDYGILAYIGFVILLQGHKFLAAAEDFYTLFGKIADHELLHGRYGIRSLKSPEGDKISVPIRDQQTKSAYEYYEKYRDTAIDLARLADTIANSELTAALNVYREVIQSLEEVGRYDLAQLFEGILGETWVALMCRHQKSLGSIPLPIGEISLDFIVYIYKRVRRWIKYRKIRSRKLDKAIPAFLTRLGKRINRQ